LLGGRVKDYHVSSRRTVLQAKLASPCPILYT
jgi:hypothetical protein